MVRRGRLALCVLDSDVRPASGPSVRGALSGSPLQPCAQSEPGPCRRPMALEGAATGSVCFWDTCPPPPPHAVRKAGRAAPASGWPWQSGGAPPRSGWPDGRQGRRGVPGAGGRGAHPRACPRRVPGASRGWEPAGWGTVWGGWPCCGARAWLAVGGAGSRARACGAPCAVPRARLTAVPHRALLILEHHAAFN